MRVMAREVVLLIFTISLYLLYNVGGATCPDDDKDLQKWSAAVTWSGNKLPEENDNVTISSPILVDDVIPELFSITIDDGGKLVFSRHRDHALSVHYILINDGGEMHIGSEDCKFEKYATISLLGEPGELSIPGFGEKFIGVRKGGVLELHGKDKLSWTKVTSTVPQVDPDQLYKYKHIDSDNMKWRAGINLIRFTKDGSVIDHIHERLILKQKHLDLVIARIEEFLNKVEDDDVVGVATHADVVSSKSDPSGLVKLLQDTLGASRFGDVAKGSAYAFVGIPGENVQREDLQLINSGKEAFAEVTLTLPDSDTKFVVESLYRKGGRKYADFMALDLQEYQPVINVVDDVSSWIPGDQIFITSTDYDWKQVEEFTILSCPDCAPNQIKLNGKGCTCAEPTQYTHYGEIFKNVDMRAEVGLMTRHIRIRGIVSEGNSNGGHVKFLEGFQSVRVEGVELTKMGQPLVLGRYPLHYHMCGNLSDDSVYPVESYIRRNSIHHTHFRCVTIHGTHHAQLFDNVCYNTFGHGFFLEDGGEKFTRLERNLGLGQQSWEGKIGKVGTTGAIPTDKTPVTFWLTNPLQTVRNNAAAGGDGVGYWYVYPDLPTGPSRDLGHMAYKEARNTAIKEFYNNVAHSYDKAGLFVDNIEQDDLTVEGYNQYDPRADPLNKTSPQVSAVFDRLTAYKNRKQNVWIRGGWMVLTHSSVSDSKVGVAMVRENTHYLEFENSVVIGESPNLGEPRTIRKKDGSIINLPRSVPVALEDDRIGCNFHKGAVHAKNVWFYGFQSTQHYTMAALGVNKCEFQALSISQQTSNIQFAFDDSTSGSNRVYVKEQTCDGRRKNVMFRDTDSSVTGIQSTVITNDPFLVSGTCKYRTNWNMAYCPEEYGVVHVKHNGDDKDVVLMRTDAPYSHQIVGDSTEEFFVILGGHISYLIYIEDSLPNKVQIKGVGIKSDNLQVGLCVPRDAVLELKITISGKRLKGANVSSLADLVADTTGYKYFFDSNVGVLLFKFLGTDQCVGWRCPRVDVEIKSGNFDDNDCSQRLKDNDDYISASNGTPSEDSTILASDGMDPPADWGAGPTYPF